MPQTPPRNAEQDGLPGAALIKLLLQRGDDLGYSKQELADAIDISLPYLRALVKGARPINAIRREKFRNIATFLNLSYIQVLMLAEIVTPTDFAVDQPATLIAKIEGIWRNMRDDPDWGRVAPTPDEWHALSLNTRYGIASMWEQITCQELIEKAPLVLVERTPQGGTIDATINEEHKGNGKHNGGSKRAAKTRKTM